MTAFDYFLLSWLTLGTLLTIGQVGKSRQPITGGVAAFVTAINIGIAVWLLISRGVIA